MKSATATRIRAPSWVFRNTDRIHRIRYLLPLYARTILRSLGRVPMRELVRTQFPFWMQDAATPPTISLELTNHCNLRCGYCTNPTTLRPRGVMGERTFQRLLDELALGGIYSVGICGNGEPTLHPRFADYVRRLSRAAPFVTLTSNWQRVTDDVTMAALESVREIHVSVDGSTRSAYEARRLGGSFHRLLSNLSRLRILKREIGSRTLIAIRVMLGRSDHGHETEILEFWKPYGDVVSRQYILDFLGGPARGYTPVSEGRCTLPFKKLDVHWNGIVNLCSYSWMQTGDPEGVVLGNLNDETLFAMWNSPLMRQYREGHRRRLEEMIPVCRGCPGRT
jgi:MoaA/NifB/PqqE/SkfB family radical SAM enzyme